MLLGLATASHQGFSSNLYTLVSDMFPKQATASVAGMGGTLGYIGDSLFSTLTGLIIGRWTNQNYGVLFIIAGIGYLVAFVVIQISPKTDAGQDSRAARTSQSDFAEGRSTIVAAVPSPANLDRCRFREMRAPTVNVRKVIMPIPTRGTCIAFAVIATILALPIPSHAQVDALPATRTRSI